MPTTIFNLYVFFMVFTFTKHLPAEQCLFESSILFMYILHAKYSLASRTKMNMLVFLHAKARKN